MSRVITFSRQFPSYHPRAGEPTYFVDKIWNSFRDEYMALPFDEYIAFVEDYQKIRMDEEQTYSDFDSKKFHTIRAGHRWKVGDWFSPRVWSGKPYNSKMIQFAPDIEVKKVWNFKIENDQFWLGTDVLYSVYQYADIAKNDGLEAQAFWDWFRFPKPFDGQIICWSDSITY